LGGNNICQSAAYYRAGASWCDAIGVLLLCASGDPIEIHTHTATMIDAKRHHKANL